MKGHERGVWRALEPRWMLREFFVSEGDCDAYDYNFSAWRIHADRPGS
jgi:hypothetical protein